MMAGDRWGSDDPVEIAGEVKGETAKAYKFYDGDRTVWLPKSVCKWDGEVMTMPEWLAVQRELV